MRTIIDTFDPDRDAILNPAAFSPPIEGFPETAAICFSRRITDIACEIYGAERISAMNAGLEIPIYKLVYKGREIALYATTIGGSATAGLFEEMISKGSRKFVFFGSCGVLNGEIAAKSLVVPTAAYRDEGVSYHYAPPSTYIEVSTAGRLAEILTELALPHVCGKTWTTDAIARETRRNMETRKNDGCLTVEMECASIMAVAQWRGVDAYQFLYAADSLDAAEWESRTLGNLPQSAREMFLRVALEVAVKI